MAGTIQEVLIQAQSIGEVFVASQPVAGPASYSAGQGNGQVIAATMFGLLNVRIVLAENCDSTETWFVRVVQAGKGATKTFRARWFVIATGAEVGGAVNLSGGTIRYLAIGN